MYFQLVESQVLSTQGQPDVNLHRLTARSLVAAVVEVLEDLAVVRVVGVLVGS